MLLKDYETNQLLCNVSVNGATSKPNTFAYRGDLVLIEGEIADNLGRRLPPKTVVKQAVILIADDKITLAAGFVHDIADLSDFVARYAKDFAPGIKGLFFVQNIGATVQTEISGMHTLLVPLVDGAVWNYMMDELRLEKDDFKGQSAEDKVITMQSELYKFKSKAEIVSWEDAQTRTVEVVKEARGPV